VLEEYMIFANLEYPELYRDFHYRLEKYLRSQFSHVESGLQGDSWFWVFVGQQKVAIDTFSSMKHQVKSDSAGPHVQRVIESLKATYNVNVYAQPELEAHEDA
jgi:hypothetical protein